MALGTTNIGINLVGTTIGDASRSLFTLGTSANVNKWSKYKPIRDAGTGSNWPAGSNGKYGFNLAGSNPNKWDYLQPRGGSPGGSPDEPVRLGDFRGYEHSKLNAYPSIQSRDTDNTFVATLYPSGSPYAQSFKLRAYRSASSVIILPSDLGYDNYYVGLKVVYNGTFYKTFCQVKDLDFSGTTGFSISAEIVDWSGSPVYSNFPGSANSSGTATWTLFISSTAAVSWTSSAPTDLIFFPTDTDGVNSFINSGTIDIHDWIKLSSNSMSFDIAGGSSDSIVYCSTDALPAFTVSDDAGWISTAVYDGETLIANPALYAPNMKVRVTTAIASSACTVDCQEEMNSGELWTIQEESGSLVGTVSRNGSVTVTSEGVNSVIAISQGAAGSNQLSFSYKPTVGEDFPPGVTDVDIWITRGSTTVFSDLTGTYKGRAGYTTSYTVTINETGIIGQTYVVHIKIHV